MAAAVRAVVTTLIIVVHNDAQLPVQHDCGFSARAGQLLSHAMHDAQVWNAILTVILLLCGSLHIRNVTEAKSKDATAQIVVLSSAYLQWFKPG